MRLSASVNFFDGGEFLVPKLRNMRPVVDHISVVYQEISNFGQPISDPSREALELARAEGLADEFHLFTPTLQARGSANEFAKRAIGIDLARRAGADHFLLTDVDEFFVPEEFLEARGIFADEGLDFSSVRYQNYYRKPTLRLRGEGGLISFICRLDDRLKFWNNAPYPSPNVDPTRRPTVEGGYHAEFASERIFMHHMTGLRVDLEEKLANSSINDSAKAIRKHRALYKKLPKIKPGTNRIRGFPTIYIEEVPDVFGLSSVADWK